MHTVCHSRSSTLYQADNFLLSTRRHKRTVPGQSSPNLQEGSPSTGSDGFHSLVQKAVADFMASVTMLISSLIATRFDNFKKQFTEENSSSVESAVKRANSLLLFSLAKEMSSSLSMLNLFWTSSRV